MSMPSECRESLETKKCVIAYLDILGTKHRINYEDEIDSQEKIHNLYKTVKWAKDRVESLSPSPENISIKIFSDDILAYIELDNSDNYLSEIDHLLHFIALVQISTHINCYWSLRGGITIGNLYRSNEDEIDFVWGRGLVRAIELEKHAIYPRVIIDLENPDLYPNVCLLSSNDYTSIKIVTDDEDGMVFVSYEEAMDKSGNLLFISKIHDSIINQINAEPRLWKTDKSILNKLKWTVSYHNKICNKYSMKEYVIPSNIFNMEN